MSNHFLVQLKHFLDMHKAYEEMSKTEPMTYKAFLIICIVYTTNNVDSLTARDLIGIVNAPASQVSKDLIFLEHRHLIARRTNYGHLNAKTIVRTVEGAQFLQRLRRKLDEGRDFFA